MLEEPRIAWNKVMVSLPPTSPPPAAPLQVMSLIRASLGRHKLLIALCGLLGLLAAYTFSQIGRPRFEASAELLVDPRDLVVLEKEVTPRSSPGDNGIAIVESQARVLQSDVVLNRAIVNLKLDEDPEFNGTRKGVLTTALTALAEKIGIDIPQTPREPKLAALQTLEQRVFVRRPERTFVVDLTVWTEDAAKSVAVADAIIKSYFEEQAAARSDPARKAGEAINSGLDTLRQKLAESEAKVSRYKTDKNLVGVSGRLVTEQQLTEINNQLLVARAELGRAKSRLEDSKRLGNGDANPEAVASAHLRQLRSQLTQVAGQKAKLSTQLQPRHPAMISVLEQERGIQTEIREELRRVIATTKIEYDRAAAVETALASDLENLRKQMNTATEAQIKLRELEAELEANRAVYQTATVRARETREQARLNTTNVRILAEPTPARDRRFPPPIFVLLPMGLMVGLGGGAFLGLLRDGLKSPTPIKNAPTAKDSDVSRVSSTPPTRPAFEQIQDQLVPERSVRDRLRAAVARPETSAPPATQFTPTAKPAVARSVTMRSQATPSRAAVRPAPARADDVADIPARHTRRADDDGPPFTFTNLRGVLPNAVTASGRLGATPADEARNIVALASSAVDAPNAGTGRKLNRLSAHLESIRPLTAGPRQPHVIIVTSDEPNTMKSVVALGLANAFAMRNRRVLLVDADVDVRSLSDALGEARPNGLEEVMSGAVPLVATIVKRRQGCDSLSVVKRAAQPRRNGINQDSLRRIVRQSLRYDVVVIEAPALNSPAVEATFSQVACQVLLAMRVPPASEDVLMGAMLTLRKAVPKFCGLVITD
jgi:polysaccharide biosynthesis transport protein